MYNRNYYIGIWLPATCRPWPCRDKCNPNHRATTTGAWYLLRCGDTSPCRGIEVPFWTRAIRCGAPALEQLCADPVSALKTEPPSPHQNTTHPQLDFQLSRKSGASAPQVADIISQRGEKKMVHVPFPGDAFLRFALVKRDYTTAW